MSMFFATKAQNSLDISNNVTYYSNGLTNNRNKKTIRVEQKGDEQNADE